MTDGQIFNADRKHAMRHVDAALSEGRIDIEDYDELTKAIADATDRRTLDGIIERAQSLSTTGVAPSTPARRSSGALSTGEPEVISTWFSNLHRHGKWNVIHNSSYTASFGELVLDMREATASHPEITITTNAYLGNVCIIVSRGVGVVNRIDTIMADTKEKADPHRPGMAVITLTGRCVMGTVKTISREPGEKLPFGFINL